MNQANYCTLEAAKRLVEAGIVLEADFMWVLGDLGWSLFPSNKDKLEEKGMWEIFIKFSILERAAIVRCLSEETFSAATAWLFTPTRFCGLAGEFLEREKLK